MSKECNVMECLRKFRETSTSDISRWCGVYGHEEEKKLIHNSKDCPYFCDRFWDYELKKEITKHEDVHWISTNFDDKNEKYYNGMFAGISREGSEKQEKRHEWENKHENTDTVVCPYCDYEFDSYDNPYEEGEEEIECLDCGKTFKCETTITYSWTTSKSEEYDEDEE
jgi:hypothetical protein